ncbi:MAG: MBL fold metallo-hydrolase [Gammaproteobacteria bacterium]|nr:MBL fold metallo-hydrolase [Gammaproteobacteria bacterium]
MRVAEDWFAHRDLGDGVTLIWERWANSGLRCNIWLVQGRDRNLLIDSGLGLRSLREELAFLSEKPVICLASHNHFDHIGGHHEFETRLCHRAEAEVLSAPTRDNTLIENFVELVMFEALPYAGFAVARYEIVPAPATGFVDEGDVIDLGDRHFSVLHLPGHSPGSIALWEQASGLLFTGDVIYDGELYDFLHHSSIPDYLESMARLRALPAETVHAGHYASFDRARLHALIDDYVAGKRLSVCPAGARSAESC